MHMRFTWHKREEVGSCIELVAEAMILGKKMKIILFELLFYFSLLVCNYGGDEAERTFSYELG